MSDARFVHTVNRNHRPSRWLQRRKQSGRNDCNPYANSFLIALSIADAVSDGYSNAIANIIGAAIADREQKSVG